MSGTIEYNGFQNLAGRTLGTLTVMNLASRQPVMWQVRCECGCCWKELHTRLLTNPQCRNSACGRTVPASPRTATIVVPIPAVRSSDSASAREYARSQTPSFTFAGEPSAESIQSADTRSVGLYLDSVKEQKERQK